jgi:hypothetical protein
VISGVNSLLGGITETGDGYSFSGEVDVVNDKYLIGFKLYK